MLRAAHQHVTAMPAHQPCEAAAMACTRVASARFAVATMLLAMMVTALPGRASADPVQHGEPVDQAVGDADGLATSLRRISAGLRSDGEQTSLFRVEPSQYLPQDLLRVAPGLRARVERIDYMIRTGKKTFQMNISPRRDGDFLEMIRANTVFDLSPVDLRQHATPTPHTTRQVDQPSNAIDSRVDGRTDSAIDGRVSNRVEPVRIDTP